MAHDRQAPKGKRPPEPLTSATLRSLALHYVGRYATSSGKLSGYLSRKLRERGWQDSADPQPSAVIEEFVRLGYIDDAGFAAARKGALLRRGFGSVRIRATVRHSGVGDNVVERESRLDDETAREAALAFARRKRIGPFSTTPSDTNAHGKAVAAMMRAGHEYRMVREILGDKHENFAD